MKDVPDALKDSNGRYLQWFATVVKVPALFYLALIVTFPIVVRIQRAVGSRLTLVTRASVLVESLAVNLAVLAWLGPIVMFFSLTTQSYAFIQVAQRWRRLHRRSFGTRILIADVAPINITTVSSPASPDTN